jgi:ABC-type transport system involved in multi-copper enzyme maturation permease subunit
MNWKAEIGQRFAVVMAVQKRDTHSVLHGYGIYAVTFLSLVATAVMLRQAVSSLRSDGFLIATDPFLGPAVVYIQAISTYLAVSSAVTIARDKDRGTLELLLYGPVDYFSYVIAKFISQIICHGASLAFLVMYMLVLSVTTPFHMSFIPLVLVLLSIFSLGCVSSMGIFLSSVSKNVRRSVLIIVGLILLLAALEAGYGALATLDIQDPRSPLLYFRSALGGIYQLGGILSPFASLSRIELAVRVANPTLYLTAVLGSLAYTGFFLTAAAIVLSRKGVRP